MNFISKVDLKRYQRNSFKDAFRTIINFAHPTLTEKELEAFLRPSLHHISDPACLKNIDDGIDLFLDHFFKNNRILVFGDYDVDGISSAALWVRFFRYLGFENYEIFIPNRFKHGYGLSEIAFADILENKPSLVITVDNGINSYQEVKILKDINVDVIITDHHTPVLESFPDCPIINPKIPGCLFPDKDVSGVGVVYLFLIALRRKLRELSFWNEEHPEPNLVSDLDLVTIGTVADQANLKGLNRIFAHFGLKQIAKNAKSKSSPYSSYLTVLYRYFPTLRYYNTDTDLISFKIAPLLNAAGRIESGLISVNFLSSLTEKEAEFWLHKLIDLNSRRCKLQESMIEISYEQAKKQLASGGLLLYDPSFHEGITGLIAGKFSREFNLPCVALANMQSEKSLKGSCRIPEGGSILNILKYCNDSLVTYGGHENAAGLVVKIEALNEFTKLYKQATLKETVNISPNQLHVADFELSGEFLCIDFFNYIQQLEPHGTGNPRPLFMVKNFASPARPIRGRNFLKWKMPNNVEAIYWNHDNDTPKNISNHDILFEMKHNSYTRNGIQLQIKAIGGP